MRAEVGYALHLAGQVCGGVRGQVKQPVFAPRIFDAGQLAAVPPAAEAESLEYRKGRRLVEDGKVEDPAFFDHLRGEVGIVDGDCQPVRRTCYLTGGIDDAAVVESVRLRGKHEEPVAECVHSTVVHMKHPFDLITMITGKGYHKFVKRKIFF